MKSTHAATRPRPLITLETILATIDKLAKENHPPGRAIYIRSDAWPPLRKELEARALVRDNLPANFNGVAGSLLGVELIVT